MKFVDDRGFADTGITRDQYELRRAAVDDAVEGGEQDLDLARSAIQLLGDPQLVERVVLAQRKIVDAMLMLPVGKTAPQIALDAGCGLVTLFGGFGEQLHDQ